jgi:hypothetical protein
LADGSSARDRQRRALALADALAGAGASLEAILRDVRAADDSAITALKAVRRLDPTLDLRRAAARLAASKTWRDKRESLLELASAPVDDDPHGR